jgi:hypothetical protein
MLLLLLIVVTATTIILGRMVLGRWLNHLSLLSALYGLVLILFAARLIDMNPVSAAGWLYLFSAWACLYLASVTFWLIRGHEPQEAQSEKPRFWEQAYRCALSYRSMTSCEGKWGSGWQLFLLLGLQAILLGATDEVDFGKLLFAIVYAGSLLWWSRSILIHTFTIREPVVRWALAVLGLGLFSRLPGMFAGVPAGDWLRDFLPLLHFSWILVGPFAFWNRESIRRAYLLFIAMDLALTILVTDQYLTLRKFNALGLGWIEYARATDSVVLFGIFMTLPMTSLPDSRQRVVFGLLTAAFVSAALLTGTRSHVGATLGGLIFYLWLTKPEKGETGYRRQAVLVSLLLGVVGFGVALASGLLDAGQVWQRTAETSSLDFGAFTQRVGESLAAWNGFQSRPVFGQGLGYRMPLAVWSTDPADPATNDLFLIHNFYMYVPLKFGLVGVPIFFGFLVSMVRSGVSTYRQAKLPFDRAFSAGLSSLLVALLVESATASRFQDRSASALLSLLMAILLSLRREIAKAEMGEPLPASTVSHGGYGMVASPSCSQA